MLELENRVDEGQQIVTEAKSRRGKQPGSSRAGLEELLACGWKIEPPVYARSDWQSPATSKEGHTYHVVLWRENKINLVSIRDNPEIQQFLDDAGLTIDYL